MKMKIHFCFIFLIFAASLSAQMPSAGTPELHLFGNPNLTIRMEIIEQTKYKYIFDDKITETPNDTAFIIVNNEYVPFKNAFHQTVEWRKLNLIPEDSSRIFSEANRVYFFFKAVEVLQPNLNFQPIAGNIWINDKVRVYDYSLADWAVRLLAFKEKNRIRRRLKKHTDPETGRDSLVRVGLAFEKVFYYKRNPMTKKELLRKLRHDIPQAIAADSMREYREAKGVHEKVVLTLKQFKGEIEERDKMIKFHEDEIAKLNSLFQKYDSLLRKRVVFHDSVAATHNEMLLFGNKQILRFPSIDSVTNIKLLLAAYAFDVQREIESAKTEIAEIDRRLLRIATNLKVAAANTELFLSEKHWLEEKKIEKDTMVQRMSRLKSYILPLEPLMAEMQETKKQYQRVARQQQKSIEMASRFRKETKDLSVISERLIIDQDSTLRRLSKLTSDMRRWDFKVENVEIQFEEGFMEDILVSGYIIADSLEYFKSPLEQSDTCFSTSRQMLKFDNRYPIGFSRKRDFENLKAKHLFTIDGNVPKYKLHLEDLIKVYLQRHEIGRRDFSPADTVLRVSFDTPATSRHWHQLKKETTYKLFEAKIFSDFVGLDRTQPNGLIQLELERKVPLITNRFPRKVFKYEMWNFGFLSYITPTLTLSKIEGNNKELSLQYRDEEVNGLYYPQRYTSTLELKRHENFSTGFDFNLVLLDIPTFKSTLTLDYGFRYGRVAVIDSLRDFNSVSRTSRINGRVVSYGVNTMQFFPRLNWVVRSDERYCFNFSGSLNWYYLRANDFNQVANSEVFAHSRVDGDGKRMFANFSMLFVLKPSNSLKGKLFFRYQYNWQFNFANTGFHQAQVGYSFYVLGSQNRKS